MIIPINPDSIGDPNQTPRVYIGDAGEVLGIPERAAQHPTGQVDLEPILSPTLRERAVKWLGMCPIHDAGVAGTCRCPEGDPRPVIDGLLAAIEAAAFDLDTAREALRRAEGDVEELRGQRDFAMRELRTKTEAYDSLSTEANTRLVRAVTAEATGFTRAVAIVRAQADLPSLMHFERPSDFRKGVLSCLAALQAQLPGGTE